MHTSSFGYLIHRWRISTNANVQLPLFHQLYIWTSFDSSASQCEYSFGHWLNAHLNFPQVFWLLHDWLSTQLQLYGRTYCNLTGWPNGRLNIVPHWNPLSYWVKEYILVRLHMINRLNSGVAGARNYWRSTRCFYTTTKQSFQIVEAGWINMIPEHNNASLRKYPKRWSVNTQSNAKATEES